jgi:hypothetical protein
MEVVMTVVGNTTVNNISAHQDTSVIGFDTNIAKVVRVPAQDPFLGFSGVAVGETIGKIRHLDKSVTPEVSFEFLVRVRVHESLSDFWIGNNQVTLHQGMNNYVLSVYASFADGTRGDITGHPYVGFSPKNRAVANVDRFGRLTGVSQGTAGIDVTVGNTTKTIDVRVVAPVTNNRPIVRRIHGSGLFSERRNILFLGEGFSNVTDFNRVATEIKDRLLFTSSHSPFNALRDSFNIWVACEPQDHPSSEAGITFASEVRVPTTSTPANVPVGNPVPPARENEVDPRPLGGFSLYDLVSLVGLPTSWLPSPPTTLRLARNVFGALRHFDGTTQTFNAAAAEALDRATFDAWLELRDHGPLQARNSKLGICHGTRLGERRAVRDIIPYKNLWYLPDEPHRTLRVDHRRRDPGFNFFAFTNEYLRSLKMADVAASDPNFNIGATWAAGGADMGLACMIVNDGYLGGTRVESSGPAGKLAFFASTIGVDTQLAVPPPTPPTSTVLNHTTPNPATVPFEVVTAVLAHELAHALNLHDEYEGSDNPVGHASVVTASPFELQELRASSNVTPFQDVESLTMPGRIDPRRAKWNLDRIAAASALAAPAIAVGTNTINVQLRAGQGKRWWLVKALNLQVFLRHPDLTRDPTNANTAPFGPLTIDASSNLAGDTLVLRSTLPITTAFPPGSTLYLPRRDKSDNILKVIHPSVLAHLTAHGPFDRQPPGTNTPNIKPENPPTIIPNFTLPPLAHEVVGLYEGGGTWTRGVYRPCGGCRMRNFDPAARLQLGFCFVCKYMLVNLIDPSVHHIIDSEYP